MLIMFNTRLKVISLFILIGLIIYPTFSDKTLLPGARLDVYVSLVLSILLFFVMIYWEVENVLLQRKAKPKRASNKKKPKENIFYHILMKVLGYIIMCTGFFCCFFLLFVYATHLCKHHISLYFVPCQRGFQLPLT